MKPKFNSPTTLRKALQDLDQDATTFGVVAPKKRTGELSVRVQSAPEHLAAINDGLQRVLAAVATTEG